MKDEITQLREKYGLPTQGVQAQSSTQNRVSKLQSAWGSSPTTPTKSKEAPIVEAGKRTIETFKELGSDVKSAFSDVPNRALEGSIDPKTGKSTVARSLIAAPAAAAEALGRTAGAVARGAGALFAMPFDAILTSLKQEKPEQIEAIKNSSGYKMLQDAFKEENIRPEVKQLFEAISKKAEENPEVARSVTDAIEVVLLGGAGQAEKQLVSKGKKVLSTIEEAIPTPVPPPPPPPGSGKPFKDVLKDKLVSLKYGKDGQKAVESLEKSYKEIPLPKNVMRAEAEEGKNFAKFMAEKPYVKMEVKNMKYDTFNTAQTLRKEATTEAKALENLLENRIETVSFDKIRENAKKAVSEATSGQERDAALRYIDNEFDALQRQYSDSIVEGANGEQLLKVGDANKLKQTFWDRSPFNPTASRQDKLASSIDYKLGHSTKKAIEDAVPDVDVRGLNSQLGDYYHAIETLENLHGGAAPRGKIGLEFARLAGATVGSQGGMMGSLVGYMTADKIATFLVQQGLSQPFKRYAVQELYKARPKVAERVIELLKKQQGEQATRALLPEPSYIPMGGATPPVSKVEIIPAKKGEPGRYPAGTKEGKGGKFFGTYKSE